MNFITEESVDKALHWLMANAAPAAKARAEKIYLEAYTKHLEAEIMKEHPKLSIAAQKREACADHRYKTHLEALKMAVERDSTYAWTREALKAQQEAWIEQSRNERAMKL